MTEIVITEFMDAAAIKATFTGRDYLYDPKLVDAPERLATLLTDCKTRGIKVRPATGANDLSVAEYVITAAMMLLRKAWFASSAVAAGAWPRNDLMGGELAGKTLGLIGFGAIGRLTAEKAQALGMRVQAYDPYLANIGVSPGIALVPLVQLLSASDVVSLHVPLTDSTRRLLNADSISQMKRGAILINAARGGIVDEEALVAALRSGQLGGAALDVFEQEPLDQSAGARFVAIPNLILTPHIATFSPRPS